MTFTVLDTVAGMREVLTAPPARREDLLRQMLTPMKDMYRYFPGDNTGATTCGRRRRANRQPGHAARRRDQPPARWTPRTVSASTSRVSNPSIAPPAWTG